MTELYLIRHGLAGERGSSASDDERPLTDEGQRKTKQVAHRLKKLGLKFDQLLSSPLVRAKQTAEILLAEKLAPELEIWEALASGGSFASGLQQISQLQQAGYDRVALVGHEPDLSEWTERLVWGEVRSRIVLKKAGVIGLELPETGSPVGRCSLFWLSPPRLLL